MKTCKQCGKELFDAAVICPQCGCPVEAQSTAAQPVQPNVEGVPTDGDPIVANVQQKLNGKIVFPIISLSVAAAGALIFLFFSMVIGCIVAIASIFVNIVVETIAKKELKQLPKAEKKSMIKKLRAKCKEYKLNFIATVVASCVCLGCGISWMALDASASFEYELSQQVYDHYWERGDEGLIDAFSVVSDCKELDENLADLDRYY